MKSTEKALLQREIEKLDFIDTTLALEKVAKQPSHQHCMLCGTQASFGLKLAFYSDPTGTVWAKAKGSIHHQGYQGILHGGFIAALLDAAMCNTIFNQGVEAVTGDMNIRYLAEIPLTADILIRGKINKHYSTLYKMESEIYVDQQLMAKCTARFIKR
ncbi:PaaI family thioesterase [Psychromonas antarctica]|jgi:acyl-coenzyme A thioesterase PaaI-like protein|uniref:PaaI family thioesterase n=1 Tax=Psychromonas antarctica TaxID=67573 RepID=UPI001EE90764|nr:PaaI family thioesterase [Psychromonas antarctica]MCG6200841.1 PaaI family thioesterase [Psychromonas antarctica]